MSGVSGNDVCGVDAGVVSITRKLSGSGMYGVLVASGGGGGDPIPSATRWRILVQSNYDPGGGTDSVNAATLAFAQSSGGTNEATGGTPSASSQFSGTYAASQAFDADSATFWVTQAVAAYPEWIEYQFSSAKSIVEVRYLSRADGFKYQSPGNCELQYHNGTTWVTQAYFYHNGYWASVAENRTWRKLANPASGEYTYWRIRETATYGNGNLIIQDLSMALTGGGADITDATRTNGMPITQLTTVDPATAFDGGSTNYTGVGTAGASWIGFLFDTPRAIHEVKIMAGTASADRCFRAGVIEASNTGKTGEWTTMYTITDQSAWSVNEIRTFTF